MSAAAVSSPAGQESWLALFHAHEPRLAAAAPWWLHGLRRSALSRFAQLGLPTTRWEEWKYTNLAPLARTAFQLAEPVPQPPARGPAFLEGAQVTAAHGRPLEPLPGIPGVTLMSLAAAWREAPELVRGHLGRYAAFERHSLVALNTAFLEDGLLVRVAEGAAVQQPIVVVHQVAPAGRTPVTHPRTLILAGRNSQARILEAWMGPDGEIYFTNAVTEICAEEGAVLEYTRLELEGDQAFHFSGLYARLGRAANLTAHSAALGGALVRSEVGAVLAGEGASCALNGLYLASGRQHIDNYTTIEHAEPHATSVELYKGILDGQAQAVFHGRIIVRPAAQKTDAVQRNRNLLLSEEAVVNTKPQLEIYADDVRCTHGATVGQVDAGAVFYLRSRGIAHREARRLLTLAFAGEMTERLSSERVRVFLEEQLLRRLEAAQGG